MDRVLVAMDGSEDSGMALEYALEQFPATDVHVIHSPDTGSIAPDLDQSVTEEAKRQATEIIDDAERTASSYGREIEPSVVFGNTVREIVRYADEHGIDQIVLGTRGRTGTKRILLGSVAEAVIRRANCPVTVVR